MRQAKRSLVDNRDSLSNRMQSFGLDLGRRVLRQRNAVRVSLWRRTAGLTNPSSTRSPRIGTRTRREVRFLVPREQLTAHLEDVTMKVNALVRRRRRSSHQIQVDQEGLQLRWPKQIEVGEAAHLEFDSPALPLSLQRRHGIARLRSSLLLWANSTCGTRCRRGERFVTNPHPRCRSVSSAVRDAPQVAKAVTPELSCSCPETGSKPRNLSGSACGRSRAAQATTCAGSLP